MVASDDGVDAVQFVPLALAAQRWCERVGDEVGQPPGPSVQFGDVGVGVGEVLAGRPTVALIGRAAGVALSALNLTKRLLGG